MTDNPSPTIEETEIALNVSRIQRTSLEQRLTRINTDLEATPSDDVEAEIARYRELTSEREGVARAIAGTDVKIAQLTRQLVELQEVERKQEYQRLALQLHEDVKPVLAALEDLVAMAAPLNVLCESMLRVDWRAHKMPGNSPHYRVKAGASINRALVNALEKARLALQNEMPTV